MGAEYTPSPVAAGPAMTHLWSFHPGADFPTMILTIVNDGPGNVVDVRIDMAPVEVVDAACPAHNLLSGTLLDGDGQGEASDDYAVDPDTGIQLCPDVLRTSKGFPAIAAGSSGFVVFKHYSPSRLDVSVKADGPCKVWAFARI